MGKMIANLPGRSERRRRGVVLAVLALALTVTALDRGNVVYGRDTTESRPVAQGFTSPTVEEMVQEMLGHD